MRICSLLPSITEVLFELGLGDEVVAVTHECDWPAAARAKPAVTRSRIRTYEQSSAAIDQQVRQHDGSLYELEGDTLAKLRPDLILTQSLCPVCAVDESLVRDTAKALPGQPAVFSYHPTCLADVRRMIHEIGELTGRATAAAQLDSRFDRAVANVRSVRDGAAPQQTIVLEWTNPPFACGHWTPELVELAGGRELLGRCGEPSRRVEWDDVRAADPDVLLIAPCGFDLPRTLQEIPWLHSQPGWSDLKAVRGGRVYAVDGSAYFNRPGPRLVDTLFILAEALHPERHRGAAPADSFQQLAGPRRIKG
jgi:iron complex transport system substrate-binding protein